MYCKRTYTKPFQQYSPGLCTLTCSPNVTTEIIRYCGAIAALFETDNRPDVQPTLSYSTDAKQ